MEPKTLRQNARPDPPLPPAVAEALVEGLVSKTVDELYGIVYAVDPLPEPQDPKRPSISRHNPSPMPPLPPVMDGPVERALEAYGDEEVYDIV